MRWILVDQFLDFEGAERARAVKNVSMGEDFASSHFVGLPIYPASLILEGLAQTGGIMVARAERFQRKVILAKVERASFPGIARPGDQLLFETAIVERRDEGFKVEGRAHRRQAEQTASAVTGGNGELIAEAVLMFVNLGGHQAGGELAQNFVFSPEFLGLFRGVDVPEEAASVGGAEAVTA